MHFGRTDPSIVDGLFMQLANLEPDCVVISGDLTQRAKTSQYLEARNFLDKITVPCLAIPGNHDISATRLIERFISPWKKWFRYISDELEPYRRFDKTIIAGINTVRRLSFSLDWSRGAISEQQLMNVEKLFAAQDDETLRILATHHPFWLPEHFSDRHLIYGRNLALSRFQNNGPDLILSGHIHIPFAQILNRTVILHAGTACSTRLVENHPNSFNIIRGNSEYLEIQTCNWTGEAFMPARPRVFAKKSDLWQEG